jgi:hypothetical protein
VWGRVFLKTVERERGREREEREGVREGVGGGG